MLPFPADLGAEHVKKQTEVKSKKYKSKRKKNTPTGASTNPKNFYLSKNLNMNLI